MAVYMSLAFILYFTDNVSYTIVRSPYHKTTMIPPSRRLTYTTELHCRDSEMEFGTSSSERLDLSSDFPHRLTAEMATVIHLLDPFLAIFIAVKIRK